MGFRKMPELHIPKRSMVESSKFNRLSSDCVWDNAEGNASCTANKTSVYLLVELPDRHGEYECLARMANISTGINEIDEIDDFSLSVDILLDMIKRYNMVAKHLIISLNKTAHEQLMVGIYTREGARLPIEGEDDFRWQLSKIAGAKVVINDGITNDQKTVI